ncbi:MAG TPA: aspartate kinase [Polyangiaceae bacterium]|nr:aspartate kinase [Polyangiaceae bacterium]
MVKKFGGTSVGSIERMRKVARLSAESRRAGNDVVVIVSAMSGETNRLLSLARELGEAPNGRELDTMVATGEQVSAAMVAMAIEAEGEKAYSLLGHQLPLCTDSAFTRARIERIDQSALRRALARGQIPVIAGFQGVDDANNITTLGRGGSDTTAVAVAAALKADVCEIYTDVDGVYTADPRVCPSGRKLKSISYEEMLELSSLGAKVLQVRSVEIAMKCGVPVHVRSSFTDQEGTWVVNRDSAMEARALTGLACARAQVCVELLGVPWHPDLVARLTSLLAELGVCTDMLAHTGCPPNDAQANVTFTLAESDLPAVRQPLETVLTAMGTGELRVSGPLAKVSLVGIGVRSDPAVAAALCHSLLRRGIAVQGLAVSELRVSCLVDEAVADQTVRVLHETFKLASAGADAA